MITVYLNGQTYDCIAAQNGIDCGDALAIRIVLQEQSYWY
jgi:hypothetical protein